MHKPKPCQKIELDCGKEETVSFLTFKRRSSHQSCTERHKLINQGIVMTNVSCRVRSHCADDRIEILKLVFAQIYLGVLGNLAKIEPHVFFCIVCDFSRFYHNCTSSGACCIYFLSIFAQRFILFHSIQLKFFHVHFRF